MKLRGSFPVIPTPFYNGGIDFDSLSRLFEHLFPQLEGCTICGSTGESVSLSLGERMELMEFAARNAPPGKKLVVGLTHTNLEEMKQLARRAEHLQVAAGLVPCPYYFPNSFAMVLEFFKALDRSSNLDLVIYDNPVYTKTWLRVEELSIILESCSHAIGVKLTDHDLEKIPALKRKSRTAVYVGDDIVAFRSLLLGADGSMIIVPAIFPQAYQEVVRLLARNDRAGALRLFADRILPFIHLFGPGDEIVNTKALFKHLGIFRSDESRIPLLPCSRERLNELVLAYECCQGMHGGSVTEPASEDNPQENGRDVRLGYSH